MVSTDLFFKINARLLKIFMCSTAVEFAGLTVLLVADLLQLPPVTSKPVYATEDINYPKNTLYLFAENYPTLKNNRKNLEKWLSKTYIINATDQIS